jgi:hypothetical protein
MLIKGHLREHDLNLATLDERLHTLEKILHPLIWLNRQYELLRQDGVKTRAKLLLKKLLRLALMPVRKVLRKFPKLHKTLIWILVKLGIYDAMFRPLKPIMNPENGTLPSGANLAREEEEVKKILQHEPLATQKFYAELTRQLDNKE